MDQETVLHSVPLFQGLDRKHVKTLARFTAVRTYEPGDVLVQEGRPGYGLFCIQSGTVQVSQKTATGSRDIRTMGEGESFGELSLLDDQPRSATVTAIQPTSVVVLDKIQFSIELKKNAEMAGTLLRTLTRWLRAADQKLAEVS